jgi:hypothetical protein
MVQHRSFDNTLDPASRYSALSASCERSETLQRHTPHLDDSDVFAVFV